MRIPPHGRNLNGSEPRVTEEKTNAPSGISNAARQTNPQIKEQQGGKLQQPPDFIIRNTKRPSLPSSPSAVLSSASFARPVLEFRREPARKTCEDVFAVGFLRSSEAPARCGNRGGGCTDADPPQTFLLLLQMGSLFHAAFLSQLSFCVYSSSSATF